MTAARMPVHRVTYDDDLRAKNGNRWPCWCTAGANHDEHEPAFVALRLAELRSRSAEVDK